MKLVLPKSLQRGDTIGVFTPSSPAYIDCEGLFLNGIKNLETLGFNVKLGSLTSRRCSQGYRSGSPKDRANELMDLVVDPDVDAIMSTIGGSNSSSLVPFLDFEEIRRQRKAFCGYSDVTSLHMAILHYSGLATFYSPALMTWFGEWPHGISENTEWFLAAVGDPANKTKRRICPPQKWSNHLRNWGNGDWKNLPRQWQENKGWKVLNRGSAKAQVVVCNLNTLCSIAGTKFFPDLKHNILLIEDMAAPHGRNERSFRQLELMGVFDEIVGLIVGKPEVYSSEGEGVSYFDLILEVVGKRSYPIIADFDCGHTLPMITFRQLSMVELDASGDWLDSIIVGGE